MKKRAAAIFFTATLCLDILSANIYAAPAEAPSNSAEAAILLHADSGAVLYEKNADERMLVASTTKIMTALVVLEKSGLQDEVCISRESTVIEGSSMYLSAGKNYTVEQLLYGMMLTSGNDAADALARYVGGSIDSFALMMNQKAAELGLTGSCFKNPHGLDEEGHCSTARDLAVITAAAMENPVFAEIVSTKSYSLNGLTYVNHNKLLWQYEGTVGVKTGYTMAAGRILVSCADRDGLRLICVTISDPDDWQDHMAMYDWGFDNYRCDIVSADEQLLRLHVISGKESTVPLTMHRELSIFHAADCQPEIIYELPRFVYAGVKKGDKAGSVSVYLDGKIAAQSDILFADSVPAAEDIKLTAWERFKLGWYRANKYGYIYYPYMLAAVGGI